MLMTAYGSDTSLPTQIKVYFRNKYFYKSNIFNICTSDQTLEVSTWILSKDTIFQPGLNLYTEDRPLA